MKLSKDQGRGIDVGLEHAFGLLRDAIKNPSLADALDGKTFVPGHMKKHICKVSASGRVTIPKAVREKLGLDGAFVAIEQVGDLIVIWKIKTLSGWYDRYFGKDTVPDRVMWGAAERALERAGRKIMRELHGLRPGAGGLVDRGMTPSKEEMRKECIRCVCGCPTKPRMFRIRGFCIRGSECPKCGEGYLNGEDICRRDDFVMLRQKIMKEIDPDYGLELSAKTKKDLARSRADIKAGRVYTLDEVEKRLRSTRRRERTKER